VPGRSLGGGTAVDRQGGAGDERGLIAQQERHECRDLLRAGDAAGGVRRRARQVTLGRRAYQAPVQRGIGVAGDQRVDPDAVAGAL
jgi:hypothetical protein